MDTGTFGYYAHNDYLQLAQEGGVLRVCDLCAGGGLCRVAGLESPQARAGQPERAMEAGLMLAVGTVYLQAVVNFMFYLVYVGVWTGLYLGRVAQATGTVRIGRAAQSRRNGARAIQVAHGSGFAGPDCADFHPWAVERAIGGKPDDGGLEARCRRSCPAMIWPA